MVVDQAEKLRLMMRSRQRRCRVLAIASGKGGVGKSNVAANLALCLMAAKRSVLLMDADLGLANLDVILGIKPRWTLAQIITGQRRLNDAIQAGPGGLKVICGASGLTQLADLNAFQRQHLIQDLSQWEHQVDVIIIDTGAGISQNVLAFCEAADQTLVVTTPEPTSMTDAYAVIKAISRGSGSSTAESPPSGTRLSLLVNRVPSRTAAKKVYQRLSQVAGQFLSLPVGDGGYILEDEHVGMAVCQREPVVLAYPRCQASFCFMALAGKIGRATEVSEEKQGFFRKVANWIF